MKGSSTVITERAIAALRPYARNARTHSKKQIKQIARSIDRFGFTNPVLISDEGEIIAGHGRVEAARLLGWKKVPTIALSHLSEAERRAYGRVGDEGHGLQLVFAADQTSGTKRRSQRCRWRPTRFAPLLLT